MNPDLIAVRELCHVVVAKPWLLSVLSLQVVEGVLLFLNLQCKHLTRTSLKQQKPGLAVTIDTTHNESAQTVCSVQGISLHKNVNGFLYTMLTHIIQSWHLALGPTSLMEQLLSSNYVSHTVPSYEPMYNSIVFVYVYY